VIKEELEIFLPKKQDLAEKVRGKLVIRSPLQYDENLSQLPFTPSKTPYLRIMLSVPANS